MPVLQRHREHAPFPPGSSILLPPLFPAFWPHLRVAHPARMGTTPENRSVHRKHNAPVNRHHRQTSFLSPDDLLATMFAARSTRQINGYQPNSALAFRVVT